MRGTKRFNITKNHGRTMKPQHLLTLLLSTLLFACGGSSSSDAPQLTPELQELKGAWQVPCYINPDDNDSGEDVFTFTNSGLSFYSAQYYDSECNDLYLEMKINASITYVGEKMISTGQTVKRIGINMDTNLIDIRLKNENLIDRYNSQSICNRTDWGNNRYKDVSGCSDLREVADLLSEPLKDIYFVNGDQLYWGDTARAVDGNGFPIALETGYSTRIN